MDLNAAKQRLNTERSEVLEHHKVVLESRVAAIEHRTQWGAWIPCHSSRVTFSVDSGQ